MKFFIFFCISTFLFINCNKKGGEGLEDNEIDQDKVVVSDFVFLHGMGNKVTDLDNFNSIDSNATLAFPNERENNTYEKTIKEQADLIKEIIKEKIINCSKSQRITIVGHSVGGNVAIQTINDIISEDQAIVGKIQDDKIEILLIPIGSPLKGAMLAKNTPKIFYLSELGKNPSVALNELGNTQNVANQTLNNLNNINKKIGSNFKIAPIYGSSQFANYLLELVEIIKTMPIYGAVKVLFPKLEEEIDILKNAVKSMPKNDGVVSVESQKGEGVIPEGMFLDETIKTFNAGTVAHYDALLKMENGGLKNFIDKPELKNVKNKLRNLDYELSSEKVLEAIKTFAYTKF